MTAQFSPEAAMADLKKHMESAYRCHEMPMIQGVIVSPELWEAIHDDEHDDNIVFNAAVGNLLLTYPLYILRTAAFPNSLFDQGKHFFFTPWGRELYIARYLGCEAALMDGKRVEAQYYPEGEIAVANIAPPRGEVWINGTTFRFVPYDEVLGAIDEFGSSGLEKLSRELVSRFSPGHRVNRAPTIEWLGKISFTDGGIFTVNHSGIRYPYVLEAEPTEKQVGHLLMRRGNNGELELVAVAKGGDGKIRTKTIFSTANTDVWVFMTEAAKWFSAEEMFVFLYLPNGKAEDLERMRQSFPAPATPAGWRHQQSPYAHDKIYANVAEHRVEAFVLSPLGKVVQVTLANAKGDSADLFTLAEEFMADVSYDPEGAPFTALFEFTHEPVTESEA